RCAVDVQREMAERNAEVPTDRRIEFRIGLNVGDIIIDDKDIYGDGVNIAARLEGLAEPGGICVSRVVRDQVRDKLDFSFEDMGEQQVKASPGRFAPTGLCWVRLLERYQTEIAQHIAGAIAPGIISAEFQQAQRKDLSQLDAWDRTVRAHWHIRRFTRELTAERYDKAIEFTEHAREANAEFPDIYAVLASAYGHLGNTAAARAALDQLLHRMPGLTARDERLVRPFARVADRERFLEGLRKAGRRHISNII